MSLLIYSDRRLYYGKLTEKNGSIIHHGNIQVTEINKVINQLSPKFFIGLFYQTETRRRQRAVERITHFFDKQHFFQLSLSIA